MTEQDIIHQICVLNRERAYIEARKAVTTLRCPICGHPLRGYVVGPMHDTCDCQPIIHCTSGCKLVFYTGESRSLYERKGEGCITKADILQSAIADVRPWIKQFGSPLEEDY